MTKDEWQAEIVERTLCNDWKSQLDREAFLNGFCEACGTVATKLRTLAKDTSRWVCNCNQVTLLFLGGLLLPPCEKCHTHVDTIAEIVFHDNESYTRLSCQCGSWRTRV